MNKKYLFCEGNNGSLDIQLLTKLPYNNFTTEIIPMGGKYSAGSFTKGFITALDGASPIYIQFRDRDFDAPLPSRVELTQSPYQKNTYMSYRATIENYLLSAKLLLDYLTSRNLNEKSGIYTAQDAKTFLDTIAYELRYYSAARYAIGASRNSFNFEKGTTWTAGSGKLPIQLDEMYCKAQSIQLLTNIHKKLIQYAHSFDREKFQLEYSKAILLFNEDFIKQEGYLAAFHGKDLTTCIIDKFNKLKIQFNKNHYFDFALAMFDYTQFADLVELADKLSD